MTAQHMALAAPVARAATRRMRGLRRQRRLRARAGAPQVQGLRRQQLLRTRAGAQQVQGLRRRAAECSECTFVSFC
jgi:hypothetical protein